MTRLSASLELAARMRPKKYESSSLIGRLSGIRDNVEEAGSREPCFDRRSSAGARFDSYGFGGVR